MRETYKMKRWMSICLIVVLFLSGMCFEKVKTDPEFGVSKTVTSGVFQSLQNPTDSQDMCSSEQLGDSMLRSTGEVLRRTASVRDTFCHVPHHSVFRDGSMPFSVRNRTFQCFI